MAANMSSTPRPIVDVTIHVWLDDDGIWQRQQDVVVEAIASTQGYQMGCLLVAEVAVIVNEILAQTSITHTVRQ